MSHSPVTWVTCHTADLQQEPDRLQVTLSCGQVQGSASVIVCSAHVYPLQVKPLQCCSISRYCSKQQGHHILTLFLKHLGFIFLLPE